MKSTLVIEQVRLFSSRLIIWANGKRYEFNARDLSPRLAMASDEDLEDFEVTPSGYGIHWSKIDEDISLSQLLEIDAV